MDIGKERSAQRNYGISKATGEYILFLDSDMLLSRTVVEECINAPHKLIYIPEIILNDKVRTFERSFYNATPIDCIRFFPRNFKFAENLVGPEDWNFDRIYHKHTIKAPLYHLDSNHVESKKKYLKGMETYKNKWKNDKWVQTQMGNRRVLIYLRKWWRLLLHPILTVKMVRLLWKKRNLL